MDLEELREKWDRFASTDPFSAILTKRMKKATTETKKRISSARESNKKINHPNPLKCLANNLVR